ncbi:MAG: DUF5680 domain-containing protein [Planctomycetes bacterium]|jgi:hypothetical protein|nr:DUF5680 domain-containing protein [Planctomycetota bacterium]
MDAKIKEKIKRFMIKAKLETYAGEKNEDAPIIENGYLYQNGNLSYHDNYKGHFSSSFSGAFKVMLEDREVLSGSYNGLFDENVAAKLDLSSEKVKTFLKKALRQSKSSFRGPKFFKDGDFEYINDREFGNELIYFKGKIVFEFNYLISFSGF